MRQVAVAASTAVAGLPLTAVAHSGATPTPDSIWSAWTWDPLVIALLLGVTIGFARGTSGIWHRAGRGRGIRSSQVFAFAAAMLLLIIAMVSPLDALGETLFSAHMVQHLLLMLVVAPLLVFARPWLPVVWSMPRSWRVSSGRLLRPGTAPRRTVDALTTPFVAWTLNLVALWIWHVPAFYDAAVASWFVHLVEHATFLGAAMLFWLTVLPVTRPAGSARQGLAVLSLFTTGLHSGLLAALLTFSQGTWYVSHASTTGAWGLTPLEDQQLAGVIMWVPMGAVYTIAAAAVLGVLLKRLGDGEPEHTAPAPGERATDTP